MGVTAVEALEVDVVMAAVYQSGAQEKDLVCAKPNYFHKNRP